MPHLFSIAKITVAISLNAQAYYIEDLNSFQLVTFEKLIALAKSSSSAFLC